MGTELFPETSASASAVSSPPLRRRSENRDFPIFEEESDEEVEVYGGADYVNLGGRGSQPAGDGGLLQARHHHGCVRPVEEHVRRHVGQRAQARFKRLKVENARLKRMYAELALENAAIKDVLSRKL